MGAVGNFTLRDWSNEKSTMRFYGGDITAVSLPGFLTEFGTLRGAVEGITLGIVANERWIGDDTELSPNLPALPAAQREKKWLVTYVGANGGTYQLEIPTADDSQADILLPSSDLADLVNNTAMAAFVAAFEQIARTPVDDTETVTVQSIRFIGRNL
jgi:hypothetical protein